MKTDKNRAWIEIDLQALEHNVKQIQNVLPSQTKIMGVVKANAYGHGVIIVSQKLAQMGIQDFAVATLDEGIELRQNGIQGEILILGYTDVVTGKECDRRRLLINDCIAIPDKQGKIWAYRIGTRSLGSGKTARLTVRDNVYQANPLAVGDIIYAAELFKNQSGYWYLIKYNIEHKEKLW